MLFEKLIKDKNNSKDLDINYFLKAKLKCSIKTRQKDAVKILFLFL